jgi:hypothetical protein
MASPKVNELIGIIKSSQKTTEIYVPSFGKEVKFKHLTAGQQEKFVQSLIDNPALQPKFNATLIEAIKECCEDASLIKNFTIIDKYAIALGLRVASIGANLKTEVDSEPGVTYVIDLKKVLDKVKTITIPTLDPVVVGPFKLDLQYPTITQELAHDKFFKRENASIENTPETIRDFISNAFISDMIMFIANITAEKDNGESVTIDFNTLSLQDKLDIVRRLPSEVVEGMLKPMSEIKGIIENIVQATGVSEADPKVKRGILVTIDSSLFMVSS